MRILQNLRPYKLTLCQIDKIDVIHINTNPCFNGRYTLTKSMPKNIKIYTGLNPCFNGRYTLTTGRLVAVKKEVSLNPCFNGRYTLTTEQQFIQLVNDCLNPCFNGRYTLTILEIMKTVNLQVLILVLMEDTL